VKLLQVPYCFYPDPVGGTEVYVESLARELQRAGDSVVIAAPAAAEASYDHAGLPVRRFALDPDLRSLEALYGDGDPAAAAAFEKVLDAERPELVHLHALTSAISPRLAASVRRRGIRLVFTYHTPTVSCPRGSLRRWGKEPCTGELSSAHCTACTLQNLGVPRWVGELLARVPRSLGEGLQQRGCSGGVWTALRMRSLIALRQKSFQNFIGQADRVVAVSAWVRDVLLRNQIPKEKIVVCRHGLSDVPTPTPSAVPDRVEPSGSLRLVFVGRLEPLKGLAILLRALKRRPQLPLKLDVFGIAAPGEETYRQALRKAAAQDARVRLLPLIPHPELIPRLAAYDLLIVPSQGLETGPLVVLEAFAAGVPVLGSRLAGISEWVDDERNGRLLEASSVQAWSAALEALTQDRSTLARWRRNISLPRSMPDVAGEMRALYCAILEGACA